MTRRGLRSVLPWAVALLALYLAWLVLLFATQRSMMFPGASMLPANDMRALPEGAQAVAIDASFGTLRAILLRADAVQPAPAVVYFHGNAELAVHNAPLLHPLAALGVHVLLVEYPGYAGSDGKPSRASLAEAGRLAHAWLSAHPDVNASRIVAMGRSVGSGPALELAAQRPVAAVVLLSPFSSLDGFAHRMGAPGLLIRDRFDNRARLRMFAGPVLLLHGRNDTVIPFSHSQDLAAAAPQARLVPMACGHNDCPYFDATFFGTLESFLREGGVINGTQGSQKGCIARVNPGPPPGKRHEPEADNPGRARWARGGTLRTPCAQRRRRGQALLPLVTAAEPARK